MLFYNSKNPLHNDYTNRNSLMFALYQHTMKIVRFCSGIACSATLDLLPSVFYFAYKQRRCLVLLLDSVFSVFTASCV